MEIKNNEPVEEPSDENMDFKTDMSFSLSEANKLSIFILLISVIIFSIPYIMIWSLKGYVAGLTEFIFNIKITFPVIIAGIFIHELIHGLFIVFVGRQSFSQVKFGFNADYYAPYAHSKTPLKALQYKISTAAPLVILGLLPVLYSLIFHNAYLLFFGIVFIFAASGDILILWKIRKVKNNNLVADHPERAGCYVYDNPFR